MFVWQTPPGLAFCQPVHGIINAKNDSTGFSFTAAVSYSACLTAAASDGAPSLMRMLLLEDLDLPLDTPIFCSCIPAQDSVPPKRKQSREEVWRAGPHYALHPGPGSLRVRWGQEKPALHEERGKACNASDCGDGGSGDMAGHGQTSPFAAPDCSGCSANGYGAASAFCSSGHGPARLLSRCAKARRRSRS